MGFIVEKLIKVKKHGPYHAPAYLLQSIRRSVSPHFDSILILNHKLPETLLLTIAERNHTEIQLIKEFDCGIYHVQNGILFDRNSTIIVFQLMPFDQEISLAEQFCELYGARAVLVKPFAIANLYEICLDERRTGGRYGTLAK